MVVVNMLRRTVLKYCYNCPVSCISLLFKSIKIYIKLLSVVTFCVRCDQVATILYQLATSPRTIRLPIQIEKHVATNLIDWLIICCLTFIDKYIYIICLSSY